MWIAVTRPNVFRGMIRLDPRHPVNARPSKVMPPPSLGSSNSSNPWIKRRKPYVAYLYFMFNITVDPAIQSRAQAAHTGGHTHHSDVLATAVEQRLGNERLGGVALHQSQ